MFIYREKENLIYTLHPLTMLTFVGVVFVLSLVMSNPVFLTGLFVSIAAIIAAAEMLSEWKGYLKYSLLLMAVIILVNAAVVRWGETVLYKGPVLPLLGEMRITLEALAFGAGMGVRLLIIISAFCLYTYAIHPDKMLKLFHKGGSRSVLMIILSTRLFPLLVQDYQRITEVQRCRGVKADAGSWGNQAKNLLPVVSVLLLSCLERSLQLAESMYVRGYGSGPRSSYSQDLWRPRDVLILAGVTVCFIIGIFSALQGWSSYSYYPELSPITLQQILLTGAMTLCLVIPAILSWGWKKWPLLKSKI